ncbi:hypothetical protein [Streptomyces sp. PT12]|uniref:hypothetical protein n=1 Tax=Streptomyces sp. PT12 TaxID=1510197 RepID=UPI0015EF58A1|nr:hypothetical protein [Streptomyces sp. PT12]
MEEVAHTTPELLDDLVTAEWGERYGRPVRLCSQPSHPVTRLTQAGVDARDLLTRAHQRQPGFSPGPRLEALRRIMAQQFLVDTRDRLRPRREKDGMPPVGKQIRSPYDLQARFALRGNTPLSVSFG